MSEEQYQHTLDGQEVEEADINLMATNGALADDRLLAELLRLAPFDGTNVAKAIIPNSAATVRPSAADGKVRIYPFRAVVGSRTNVGAPPAAVQNWRDIRSAVYAVSDDNVNLGHALGPFANNGTANPRWDLVYAQVTVDGNGSSATRFVKAAASGVVAPQTVVRTLITNVFINIVAGNTGASPWTNPIPADGAGNYNIPLAYVRIPPGFSAGSTILTSDIYDVSPAVGFAATCGGPRVMPASALYKRNGGMISDAVLGAWGVSGTRPHANMPESMIGAETRLIALDLFSNTPANWPIANGGIIDDTIDWRGRIFWWQAMASNSGGLFAWDPGVSSAFVAPPHSGPGLNRDYGFGQSFYDDGTATLASIGGGTGPMACLLNKGRFSSLPAADAAIWVDPLGGQLKLSAGGATNPQATYFILLHASARKIT